MTKRIDGVSERRVLHESDPYIAKIFIDARPAVYSYVRDKLTLQFSDGGDEYVQMEVSPDHEPDGIDSIVKVTLIPLLRDRATAREIETDDRAKVIKGFLNHMAKRSIDLTNTSSPYRDDWFVLEDLDVNELIHNWLTEQRNQTTPS